MDIDLGDRNYAFLVLGDLQIDKRMVVRHLDAPEQVVTGALETWQMEMVAG